MASSSSSLSIVNGKRTSEQHLSFPVVGSLGNGMAQAVVREDASGSRKTDVKVST